MTTNSLLKNLINIKQVFIEKSWEENSLGEKAIIIRVRQHKAEEHRCPVCGKKCARYDKGHGVRRWRGLDGGLGEIYIECEVGRIKCPEHGVLTERVSWARRGSSFTKEFEEEVAWLVKYSAKTAVSALMRISWWTVGAIVKRVTEEKKEGAGSPFDGLVRIGIDETSYKKGHKYMMTVVNHDTGKMIYCTASYGKAALEGFLQQLTEEQRASIRHITADGARWIAETVKEWCPNAERSIDPFHVVGWVNDALDEVRKRLQREATERVKEAKSAKSGVTKEEIKALNKETNELKDAKYATLKNPENLTAGQAAKVDLLAKSNPALYRAYLLKEKLRLLFKQTLEDASIELKGWLSWAQRCRIPEFQKLREKIKRHYDAILSTIKYGLSNSIVEALNNKIKLCIRMAYGFRNTNNMLGLVMLRCSDLDISLPGRSKMTHYY